jgi:hypothetical protein
MSAYGDYKVTVEELSDEKIEYSLGDCIREVWKNAQGVRYNPYGPAVTLRDIDTQQVISQEWYDEAGRLHRENGPAILECYHGFTTQYWYKHGVQTREDGPAKLVTHDKNGMIVHEEWIVDGLEHRIGGPSRIMRDWFSGVLIYEAYRQNGALHREDGPAGRERDENTGVITDEIWAIDGYEYRKDGPSHIRRDRNTGAVIKTSGGNSNQALKNDGPAIF